jgi:hypothetical protein
LAQGRTWQILSDEATAFRLAQPAGHQNFRRLRVEPNQIERDSFMPAPGFKPADKYIPRLDFHPVVIVPQDRHLNSSSCAATCSTAR